jgi:hypothetical protein
MDSVMELWSNVGVKPENPRLEAIRVTVKFILYHTL